MITIILQISKPLLNNLKVQILASVTFGSQIRHDDNLATGQGYSATDKRQTRREVGAQSHGSASVEEADRQTAERKYSGSFVFFKRRCEIKI